MIEIAALVDVHCTIVKIKRVHRVSHTPETKSTGKVKREVNINFVHLLRNVHGSEDEIKLYDEVINLSFFQHSAAPCTTNLQRMLKKSNCLPIYRQYFLQLGIRP